MTMRLMSTFVLVLGVAVFAGPAFAGNGHGNEGGNGRGNADGAALTAAVEDESSPGKSENAPGQAKKEAEAEQPAPVEEASVVVAEESPANSEGVKPSNTTEHETHAAASSDKTKKYGNGRTAGQIAIQNGAAPSTILHGPGNSQPHKAAPCSGRHEVDVHALKGKGHQKACGVSSPPVGPAPGNTPGGNSPGGNSSSNPSQSSAPKPESGVLGADPGSTPADPGTTTPAGGVPSSVEQGSQGVLAAAAVVGRGTLPFTGFPLWAVALVALMLLGFGLALRRQAGATVKASNR
jgi:hypothetical protein